MMRVWNPIRALVAALLPLVCTLVAPPALAQSDWQRCADEGSQCRFSGEALVRFGADGRYTFGVMRDGADCDTDTFGDPAPGVRKRCEISRNWRDAETYRGWRHRPDAGSGAGGWRFCADEGRTCDAGNGSAEVRFGANGRYATRTVTGRIECNTGRFGDPAPGVRKRCEVRDDEWTWCADERDTCNAPAGAEVRYGANGRYATRQANGPVGCRNTVFGDPVPGVAKQCEYRTAAGSSTPGSGPAGPLVWIPCADEGRRCELGAPTIVRFGTGRQFVYAEADRSLSCARDSFGGRDPAPGQRKQCQALRR